MSLDASLVPVIYRIRVIEDDTVIVNTTRYMSPEEIATVRTALREHYGPEVTIEIYPA